MGSMLGDWLSFDPMNFSQVGPSDPSSPSRMTPVTYCPTHDRCLPPPNQVIASESRNILLTEDQLRSKRPASENLTADQGPKHPRTSTAESPVRDFERAVWMAQDDLFVCFVDTKINYKRSFGVVS